MCSKPAKLACRSIWMDIIDKCPEVFFHVEQFVLAATPFFAYRNLLSSKPFPSCYGIIFSSYRQKTVYTSCD